MLYCEHYEIPFHMYTPAQGEGGHFRGTKALMREGVYVGGINYHHAMEAMRGFMQWFTYLGGFKFNKGQEIILIAKK